MSERPDFVPAKMKHAAHAPGLDHVVGNRNRWSRVALTFGRLVAERWYEFSAYMVCAQAEPALGVKDFAAIGVAFRAQDRSEIDVARVPGLARTSMDAHGDWLAGPGSDGGANGRVLLIRRCFYLPAPAAEVTVVVRSWRNAHPFRITDPGMRPVSPDVPPPQDDAGTPPRSRLAEDGRILLGPRPVWFRHGLVPGRALVFKGQVIARGRTEGALAQICFRDAGGHAIPPPYPDTLATLAVPAFLDIPVHRQAYRFTLKVSPPERAATLEIGFGTWEMGADLALAAAPDVFLDDDLRLASLADDAESGAETVLARLLGRPAGPRRRAPRPRSSPISIPPS